MKISTLSRATIGLLLIAAATSGAAQPGPFASGSRISISGTSTLRSFSCDVTTFESNVEARTGVSELDIEKLSGVIEAVTVSVSTGQLDCRNRTMNEHMLKALKANAHPQIGFRLTNYEVVSGEGAEATVRARGQLTMAGQTKAVTLEGTATPLPNGAVQFRGSYPVMLTEWAMTPPTLMLGTIRVGNRIVVNYDVIIRP